MELEFSESFTDEQLQTYCDKLSAGNEFNYTTMTWGHAITMHKEFGKYVKYISGFYSSIVFKQRPKTGDLILAKTEAGKIGRYLILKIEWKLDPSDMFFAYIVCVGHNTPIEMP